MPARSARRDDVVAAVRALAGDTRFVGIDGCGAAGKSSLAAAVAAAVEQAVVVAVDDFSGPQLSEWDWPRMQRQLIDPLLAGRVARYQRWDWDTDAGAEWHEVPPGRVVVVEGVSSTRSELRVPWDLRVWVDAPRELRLARAIDRDGPGRRELWLEHWMPSEDAYVARERPRDRADLVVDGTVPL